MASHSETSYKGLLSSTRILFNLLPGLGIMIVLRMAIHVYRPDIEDAENRVRDHPFENLYDCYDFIIVGAGSAGAVLANRLTENQNWKVLLLEAGQDENVLSDVPVLFPVLQTSSVDWQFLTEASDGYCLSMVDRKCKWPRGKVLGGSSVLNAMLYIRGNKRDYDNWEAMGNVGWSYKDVLPYFLKSEGIRIPDRQNDPFHNTEGPLTVEYFAYEQPITRNILEAGVELGYEIRDVNGEFQTGFTRSQATIRDGLRCSTAKAFLRPVSKRKNLHVSVHSLVEKILIDDQKVAYGVQFRKHGHEKIIKASKEVILSAGALQSPQLLMLSGIGDAEHLKELGIYTLMNLPGVGKNLQDHVAMGGHSFLFDNPYDNGTDYCFNINSVMSLGSLIDFSIHKTGALYSMMEAEAMAFVNTKYQNPAEDYPDIQLFIAPTADNMDGGLFGKRANGLNDDAYAALYEDILYESSFSVVPLLLRPKSRGYLMLRDSNPTSPPLIYPNYYTDPQDVKVMIEGARIVQDLVNQPALKKLNARPNPRRNPGCAAHELMSDEHLECQARHHTLTIYHPVGTCAMGPENDPGAVVDPRLKVYGIKNLRVIDGSVMPKIVNGNTNAPIIMIAEKASDMIKEDWSNFNDDTVNKATCLINSENDEPTKVHMKPDFFNETTSLLPHLNVDIIPPKPYIDPISVVKDNAIIPNTKANAPVNNTKLLPKKPNAYPNDNDQKPYPNYPYDAYGQKPNNNKPISDLNVNVNKYSKHPFYSFLQDPYQKYPCDRDPNLNLDYKDRNLNKYSQNYPYNPLSQNALNQDLGSLGYVEVQNPVIEVITRTGRKKCRAWFYFNGHNYCMN